MRWKSLCYRADEWFENYTDSRRKWNSWFAWYPVSIDTHTVWLERIERKRVYEEDHELPGWWKWEYRSTNNETNNS